MKALTVAEKFARIAQQTIAAAEAVECDFDEFVDGLGALVETLADRYQTACEKQRERKPR
jgi:hypothetical protein